MRCGHATIGFAPARSSWTVSGQDEPGSLVSAQEILHLLNGGEFKFFHQAQALLFIGSVLKEVVQAGYSFTVFA